MMRRVLLLAAVAAIVPFGIIQAQKIGTTTLFGAVFNGASGVTIAKGTTNALTVTGLESGAGAAPILLAGTNSSIRIFTTAASSSASIEATDQSGIASFQALRIGGLNLNFQASQVTKLDYGVTTAGTWTGADPWTLTNATIKLTGITTGANADFLCLSATSVVLLQTSACTISSMRFKNLIGPYHDDPLATVAKLEPIAFTMKPGGRPNPDWNYDKPQIGLSAENVAAIEPRCAVYEDDGTTPKSYRQECLIAVLVAGMQAQQREIAALKAVRR